MQTWSDEVKAKLIVDWQAGASQKQLVAKYGVPQATLRHWIEGLERVEVEGVITPVSAPKRTLADLAYDLAAESFAAEIAILRLAQDREWLLKQNANDLAIFFGVNADKLYRLLPAFAGPGGPDNGSDDAQGFLPLEPSRPGPAN